MKRDLFYLDSYIIQKDISNYIGPNTFAEIGLAFYKKDKKIYKLWIVTGFLFKG